MRTSHPHQPTNLQDGVHGSPKSAFRSPKRSPTLADPNASLTTRFRIASPNKPCARIGSKCCSSASRVTSRGECAESAWGERLMLGMLSTSNCLGLDLGSTCLDRFHENLRRPRAKQLSIQKLSHILWTTSGCIFNYFFFRGSAGGIELKPPQGLPAATMKV